MHIHFLANLKRVYKTRKERKKGIKGLRAQLSDFCFSIFASGPEKSMIFLLVALQVQQHEVLFGRVAALQYAVLFASLKKTN
ncbi:hypothetical protein BGV40_05125 [Methanosarcina sp. Ant1]|nr:hypothetical protein BGV40_05125 [Methanosarcina sp. Ant1]